MSSPPARCRLSRTGQLTLPSFIARRLEASGVACLAVTSVEPGCASLSTVDQDALARAELAVMLTLVNADLAQNPSALMKLPCAPASYVQHRNVLDNVIDGPSGL